MGMSIGTLQQQLQAVEDSISDTDRRREYHIEHMVHFTSMRADLIARQRSLRRQIKEAEHAGQ